MESIAQIGSIGGGAMIGVFLLTCTVAFLMGLWRGLFKSVIRTVSLIAALIIALVLVNTVLGGVIDTVADEVMHSTLESDMEDVLASDTAMEVISQTARAIVAPILFLVIYFVINKLMLIVCLIVNIFTSPLRLLEKSIPCRRLIGAGISLVGAIVTMIAISVPFGGYVRICDDFAMAVEQSEEGEFPEEMHEMAEDMHEFAKGFDTFGISFPYALGGGMIFDSLSTMHIEYEGEAIDTTVRDELTGILYLVPRATSIGDMSFDDIEAINVQPLRDVISALEDKEHGSQVVLLLTSDILSNASSAWLSGKTFLEINLDELFEGDAAMFRPSAEIILERLAATTPDTIGEDLNAFVDVMEDVQHTYAYMAKLSDPNQQVSSEDLEDLLMNLTSTSVEVISASMQPVIEQSGMDEKMASAAAGFMTDTLGTLAKHNEDGTMTVEDRQKEAEALSAIMDAAYAPDTMTEEKANALVEQTLATQVVAESVRNTAKTSAAEGTVLGEGDTAVSVNNALDSFMQTDSYDAEKDAATIDALRVLFPLSDN